MRPADIPAQAYIRARIQLQSTAEGGRRNPILSGYRPDFALHLAPEPGELNGAAIFLEGTSELAPGESGTAWLQPIFPEYWQGLTPKDIAFYEGNHLIGTATIIEIRSDLVSAAK